MDSTPPLPPPLRAVKLKTGTYFGRAITWLVAIAVFVVAPLMMNRDISRLRTLQSSGKEIEATLVSDRVTHGKGGAYYMTVSFNSMGRSVSGEKTVSYQVYNRYWNQNTVPVVANPSDPTDYEVGAVNEEVIDFEKRPWLMNLAVWGLLVCIFLILIEGTIYKERRLLANGEAVMGEVLSVKVNSGRSTSTTVTYRYKTQFGEREGKSTQNGGRRDGYPVGSQILVVYDKNNDRKSLAVLTTQFVNLAD